MLLNGHALIYPQVKSSKDGKNVGVREAWSRFVFSMPSRIILQGYEMDDQLTSDTALHMYADHNVQSPPVLRDQSRFESQC